MVHDRRSRFMLHDLGRWQQHIIIIIIISYSS